MFISLVRAISSYPLASAHCASRSTFPCALQSIHYTTLAALNLTAFKGILTPCPTMNGCITPGSQGKAQIACGSYSPCGFAYSGFKSRDVSSSAPQSKLNLNFSLGFITRFFSCVSPRYCCLMSSSSFSRSRSSAHCLRAQCGGVSYNQSIHHQTTSQPASQPTNQSDTGKQADGFDTNIPFCCNTT